MLPSIDDSIGRLKGEILSQDWRITPARAEALATSFAVLQGIFTARRAKAALGILAMSSSVLAYIRKQGDTKLPGAVDFLKEAMAHLVFFYEEPSLSPASEKETFQAVFSRFQVLKNRLGRSRSSGVASAEKEQATDYPEDVLGIPDLIVAPRTKNAAKPADPHVETLVRDLKDSLLKAEEVGTTIRHLLSDLRDTGHPEIAPAATALLKKNFIPTPPPPTKPLPELPPRQVAGSHAPSPEASPCPVAPILPVEIAGRTIAIEQDLIVGRRAIAPSRKKSYISQGSVPLADFKKFMESLKSQFTGAISRASNSKLKKLCLPVLTPRGIGLSERIDDGVDTILVIESGHWNGVLLCSSPGKPEQMTHFQAAQNGDIAGIAHTEKNRYFLLDGAELLKREGFLVVT